MSVSASSSNARRPPSPRVEPTDRPLSRSGTRPSSRATVLTAIVLNGALALLTSAARSAPVTDATARKPEVWAILIGIDLYDDPDIPRCPGALRDGGRLARWFNETARWDKQHVLLLNENGLPRHGRPEDPVRDLLPTRENLDWALRHWLGRRIRPGDVAVVYFAGRVAFAEDREWLLPIDARAGDLAQHGWSPEEAIDELVSRTPCTMVLWLDAAALGRERPVAPRADDERAAVVRLLNRLARWPGTTAWVASSARPTSTGAEQGGSFVSALLEGLGSRPANLLACLDRMLQDPALKEKGFRVRGGISPLVTLWPGGPSPVDRPQPELLLQRGHADALTAVALSADGELMITASMDSTVRVWRVRDRERILLRVLPSHTIGVTALATGRNGRFVASGDGAGQVRVWDLAEHREKPRETGPPPHRERITSLTFLPDNDGGRFVSLDQDGRSMLWDANGALLRVKPLVPIEAVRLAAASREGPAALALAEPDGKLLLIGVDGKPKGSALLGTGARPTALHLAPDGRRVAAGDEDGHVRVWDVGTGAIVFRHDYDGRDIRALRVGPDEELAVGAGDRLYLADSDRDGPGLELEGVGDEVDTVLFSDDGRWLSALTTNGNQHLWSLSERGHPAARTPAIEGRSTGATCLAFGRDGRRLVAGEGDGGIRSWDLADGRERPRIPPSRGKVEALDVSVDGRFLLQIGRDGQALIWDLKGGRGARALPGRWTSGLFLPDGSRLAMTRDANQGGDVVLVDRENGRILTTFERPRARGGDVASRLSFGRVAVARDGRKVAASAAAGQVEVACVWDIRGGPPRTLRGHTRTITALAFSGDGRSLLTASEDGTAKFWDLAPDTPDPAPVQPAVVLGVPPSRAITAAQISPANPRRIVTAQWAPGLSGQVFLWDWEPGRPSQPLLLGELSGRPHTLVFTRDGRWVVAAGQDKKLHAWLLEEDRAPSRVEFEPGQQHNEQVKALTAWPGAPLIASGGDDTTVRLWTLDPTTRRGTLLGTMVAAPGETPGRGRPDDTPTVADWVAFTPSGVYDSSLSGESMVSFVLDREVRSLEQYAGRFHKFQLTDDLRRGICPQAPAQTPPPALVIDPPMAPDPPRRDVELRITLADPSLDIEELRLYQNGVPVQSGRDFRPLDGPGHFAARVRLRSGMNRFYAMAGRRGDIDARSRDVEIRYEGQDTPGRLHVLALGVQGYTRNALRFADRDAVRIADHLHRSGMQAAGGPGEKIVLIDGDVTEKQVEDAFTALRRAVKGRPEDTVVVFLAGHTDVLKDRNGRERFGLLLPTFPFPGDSPRLAADRGAGAGNRLPSGVDLPFYVLYRNLAHLDALQRLVIIDACQAEAIYNDPGVRLIREVLEKDSHRTRTSYLLAARRGEPANESPILEHGLLTYVLLRGLKAPGLRPLPIRVPPLEEPSGADGDGDRVVTTRELREYADRTLPVLASQLPDLARRSGLAGASASPMPPEPLRFQASEDAVFRLVTLPVGEGREE